MKISDNRRVVITGMGMANPLGIQKEEIWQALLEKRSAITPSSDAVMMEIECPVSATVARESLIPFLKIKKSSKFMANDALLGIKAAGDALQDAHFRSIQDWHKRIALFATTGITFADKKGFYAMILEALYEYLKEEIASQGKRIEDFKIQPFDSVPLSFNPFNSFSLLTSMAICHISIEYGLLGQNLVLNSFVNQSVNTLLEAYKAILRGSIEFALVGATESRIHFGGSQAMKFGTGLYNRDTYMEVASRPMQLGRCGAVPSEGAAFLFLETLESAKKRGVHIFAEIKGFGQKNVFSDSEEEAVEACIKAAVMTGSFSNRERSDMTLVVSSAASDIQADNVEAIALERVCKDTNAHILLPKANYGEMGVSSFFTGVALGALAVTSGTLPPNLLADSEDKPPLLCKDLRSKGVVSSALITAFDAPDCKAACLIGGVDA